MQSTWRRIVLLAGGMVGGFASDLVTSVLTPQASGVVAAETVESSVQVDARSVVDYVRSCRKPNGAFGPADQEYTDAAWNYPAVETLRLLGKPLSTVESRSVLAHGLGYPQGHLGYGHWQFFHQHQLRRLLGEPLAPARRRVTLEHQGFEIRYYGSPFGTSSDLFFKAGGGAQAEQRDVNAERLGYYNLSSLYYTLAALEASGREADDPAPLVAYILARQAPNGGFVDVRSAETSPRDDEAHVAHTYHALASLRMLGRTPQNADRCTAFLAGCQTAEGGFAWNPRSGLPGNRADVYYVRCALRSFELLGARPPRPSACRDWINLLQNADGGFGDQPGWRSRLYSTYYAVDSLASLDGQAAAGVLSKRLVRRPVAPLPVDQFRIYQGLHKMPLCEPDDLPELQRRGFSLLALKSDDFAVAQRLRDEIQRRRLPMDVVLCPEAYPHRLLWHGGATLNHVGNFTLDPRWSEPQRAVWQAADLAGRESLAWPEYRRRVLEPLEKQGGFFYPEQDFEMEFAYAAYDQAVVGERRDGDGYSAFLAGFNWAPRDFIRVFPWRERYVDKLAPIADADAHGDLKKWSPQLDHVRHLFIARGPTYADFCEAAAAGRVVCVIADLEGVASGATLYGAPAAVDFAKRRQAEWRWWSAPTPAKR